MLITDRAQSVLRRIGKLLILRLTPRGLRDDALIEEFIDGDEVTVGVSPAV